MISYKNLVDDVKFSYRAGVILINNNKVLLQNKSKYDFWILPGGRVEFFESSMNTITRELKEELNISIIPDRLVMISEVILKKEKRHELGMYYVASINQNEINQKQNLRGLDDKEVLYKWYDINEIKKINVYPEILKEIIINIPKEVIHHIEEK